MANIIYNDSSYRFSEPVRFFKANDPYYFEVDNIPLKQLQENCLWLRDQLGIGTTGPAGPAGPAGEPGAGGQPGGTTTATDVKRASLDELRPFCNKGDRIVRVKPGRYSARINNVSEKEKLQYLSQVLGQGTGSPYEGEIGDGDEYLGAVQNVPFDAEGHGEGVKSALLAAGLNKFKNNIKSNGLGMGGLEERAFTWPVQSANWPFDGSGITVQQNPAGEMFYGSPAGSVNSIWNVPMPIHQALMWAKQGTDEFGEPIIIPVADKLYNWRLNSTGFGQLPYNESYWVKRWRGITKISIVDVPNELEIEVPEWKSDDFYYIDEDGNKQAVGAASRIDMVFIYSKPIDATGITIWKQGFPQKINAPELGIVKGAGIGVPFSNYVSDGTEVDSVNIEINAGQSKMNPWGEGGETHTQMLAAAGDQMQDAENYGFLSTAANDIAQDVVGSFPSPDDIMNLAPLLANQLEEDAIELVGQSILPVAYIFVQNNGSTTVEPEDIIDIRPFFRTTELAYNERAGIAAAIPQLSLANPAVGKAELNQALGEVKSLIPTIDDPPAPPSNMNLLAAGQVYGGWYYGPEAALVDYEGKHHNPGYSLEANKYEVSQRYGYPTKDSETGIGVTFDVPDYPDWNIAPWASEGYSTAGDAGYHVNDRINTFTPWGKETTAHIGKPPLNDAGLHSGSYRYSNVNGKINGGTEDAGVLGTDDNVPGYVGSYSGRITDINNANNGGNSFNFISKIYKFTRPTSMFDYNVDVTFLNCMPMTSPGGYDDNPTAGWTRAPAPQYGGTIWVEKGFDHFVIYVSTSINRGVVEVEPAGFFDGGATVHPDQLPQANRDDGAAFANFFVPTMDILNRTNTSVKADKPDWKFQPGIAICTYPSVSWTMTEIPAPRPSNYNTAQGGNSFNSFADGVGTHISLY
jgi:hypothetical protein